VIQIPAKLSITVVKEELKKGKHYSKNGNNNMNLYNKSYFCSGNLLYCNNSSKYNNNSSKYNNNSSNYNNKSSKYNNNNNSSNKNSRGNNIGPKTAQSAGLCHGVGAVTVFTMIVESRMAKGKKLQPSPRLWPNFNLQHRGFGQCQLIFHGIKVICPRKKMKILDTALAVMKVMSPLHNQIAMWTLTWDQVMIHTRCFIFK